MVRLHLRIPMNSAGHSGERPKPVEPRAGLSGLATLGGHAVAALSAAPTPAPRIAWSAAAMRQA